MSSQGTVFALCLKKHNFLWPADSIPERDAEHYQEKPHTKDKTHRLEVQFKFLPTRTGYFQNVSFEVHAGDVIGILGHNGPEKQPLIYSQQGLLKQRGESALTVKNTHHASGGHFLYLVMQDTDYQLCHMWRKKNYPLV